MPCWWKVTQAVKDHRWTFLGCSHSPTSAHGSIRTWDEAALYGFCTVLYNGFCPLACSNGAGLGSCAAVTWPAAWFSCPTRAIPPVLSLGGLWEERSKRLFRGSRLERHLPAVHQLWLGSTRHPWGLRHCLPCLNAGICHSQWPVQIEVGASFSVRSPGSGWLSAC